ncbi:MAG TPA: hypothetical protein VES20_16195, partial [Bryobacteraceae bacterium]|nr:hypothetical protein [Bryobacteraceae bacterium]
MQRIRSAFFVGWFLSLWCCEAARSQQPEPAWWAQIRRNQPTDLQFSMQMLEPHTYMRGELIRVRVRMGGDIAQDDSRVRVMWHFSGF